MLTSMTQSISIDAPPETVLDFVGDGGTLPQWAPAFAQSARPDGEHWLVESSGAKLRIDVRVSREQGTVDFLAAGVPPERAPGVFTRVVPRGHGSEFVFTRFFSEGTADADIARERAVVAGELETVRARCEAVR